MLPLPEEVGQGDEDDEQYRGSCPPGPEEPALRVSRMPITSATRKNTVECLFSMLRPARAPKASHQRSERLPVEMAIMIATHAIQKQGSQEFIER